MVYQNGWIGIGGSKKNGSAQSQFFLSVRAEPDPRFVFKFDGEPECSPQVFQVQGNVKQPVFTCKFGFRSASDMQSRLVTLFNAPSFFGFSCKIIVKKLGHGQISNINLAKMIGLITKFDSISCLGQCPSQALQGIGQFLLWEAIRRSKAPRNGKAGR